MLLTPHPEFPPSGVSSIDVNAWRDGDRWHFRYLLEGAGMLVLPKSKERIRADDLWRTSCFEAFVGDGGHSYREFNFAPSGQWAAYAFEAPRSGMKESEAEVEVWLEGGETWIALEAAVSADLTPQSPLGLTAVIEEEGGVKSYWALSHAKGPPDFHHPDCFTARLPSVSAE